MSEGDVSEAPDADEEAPDSGEEAPHADEETMRSGEGDERDAERPSRAKRRRSEPMERGPRLSGPLRAMAFGLLIVIGACIGGAVVRWIIDALRAEPEPPAEVIEVRPTPDVITAVRDLARLETASFHVERVVDVTSRQRRLFGLVEAEDSILLVAASDVVAGVDLARLQDGDVILEPDLGRAIVVLPPVEIFSARLDNDRTYVHRRETDTLARRRTHLETEARREAERTLRAAALEGGIIDRAEHNAAATVEALVLSLGFDEVEVRFAPSNGEPTPERAAP